MRAWFRDATYATLREDYESEQQRLRAEYKSEFITAGLEDLGKQITDIETQYYEQTASDVMDIEQARVATITEAANKSGLAAGKVGRTVTALQQQYAQQYSDYIGSKQIVQKFRAGDQVRALEASRARTLSNINSIKEYTPQPIKDPLKPDIPRKNKFFKPRDMKGPSKFAMYLDIATSATDALQSYARSQPSDPKDPGTGGGNTTATTKE